MLKAVLIYPPLGETPDTFLPTGILLIAQSLREEGVEVKVLNLDYNRLSLDEAQKTITDFAPNIVGYSAVTSTHYKFIKMYTQQLRSVLSSPPLFIVGGNIVASSKILLEKAHVDICFIGESYFSIKEFIKTFNPNNQLCDFDKLKTVKGLAFKNLESLYFTGKRKNAALDEIPLIYDFSDIDTNHYFPLVSKMNFNHFPLSVQEKVKKLPPEARFASVMLGSGCQNICSFCHRNVEGVRFRDIDKVFKYIDHLIKEHDVQILNCCDESFFVSKKWLADFTRRFKERNILLKIAGVRANMIIANKEILQDLKQAGLIEINIGLESGSQRVLNIMDKNINISENYEAIEIINDLDVLHTPQIILGMPTDSPREAKKTEYLIRKCQTNAGLTSINIAQVLPGTPLYWYAIRNKLISDEEDYLLRISDKGADLNGTVNVSEYPLFVFDIVRRKIVIRIHFSRKNYHATFRAVGALCVRTFQEIFSHPTHILKNVSLLSCFFLGTTFKSQKETDILRSGSLRKAMQLNLREQESVSPLDALRFGANEFLPSECVECSKS